jgi:hypothetical protein
MLASNDIEKTTISVRSFATSMWVVVAAAMGIAACGAFSWSEVKTSQELILTNQAEQKVTQAAESQAQQQLAQQMITLAAQIGELQKRMDDYRPFKWSTPMEIEYTEQLKSKNPTISAPDVQLIHDKILPFTP